MAGTFWTAAFLFANLWASGGLDADTTKAASDAPWKNVEIIKSSTNPAPFPLAPKNVQPEQCRDQPPSTAEVLRALPKTANIPYVYDENRDVFEVKVEKISEKVDAPRFYPLIGPALLHHCRWKCTVQFNRVVESSTPFPFRVFNRCTEVVYVEKSRLELAHPANDGGTAETSEPPLHCPGGHNKTSTELPRILPARPVAANNLRQIYLIVEDGELGQHVTAMPAAEQTVSDVVSKSVHADKVRKVRVMRISADGKNGVVELPVDWKAITRDGHTASNYQLEAGDRVHVFVEPAKAVRIETMSLDVVVRMSKAGVSPKIIIRQIEQTGANFDLSADDIIYLREQGVSNRVISVMQERREKQSTSSRGHPGSMIVGGLLGTGVGAIVGNSEDRGDNRAKCAVAAHQMSLSDIITLSGRNTPDEVIINQINTTRSLFNLTTNDILDLQNQGVSQNVLNYMQTRRYPPTSAWK
jgi:hypothetical protein